MPSIRGFDRPAIQWTFVALALILMGIAAGEAIGLRRLRASLEQMRAENMNARVEKQQTLGRLAHEQSARESFALELARQRGGSAGAAPEPTLTLAPIAIHRSAPPEPTVAAPPPAQSIQLRLLLPRNRVDASKRYAVALRSWSGGTVLWTRSGMTASEIDGKAVVTSRLTGDTLPAGAYEVALTEVSSGSPPAEVAFYEITIGS